MDPNIVIKQEPIDPDEVEMMPEPVALDPLIQVKSETVSSPSSSLKSSKHPRKPKSTTKLQKKVKEKRKAPMDPHFGEKEEKMKKIPKTEKESYYEPTRAEVYPDHSMSDFYCAVCDSHMNSVQVWESHIQGKRHLKNLKKELSVTSVKKEKTDDTTDMYYIDTRGAPSPSSNSAGNERRPLSPPESRLRCHTSQGQNLGTHPKENKNICTVLPTLDRLPLIQQKMVFPRASITICSCS